MMQVCFRNDGLVSFFHGLKSQKAISLHYPMKNGHPNILIGYACGPRGIMWFFTK